MNAYEKVKYTRSKDRLLASDFINNVFTDFLEMHGDRRFRDDKAVIAGVALLDDTPVTVIGIEKGRTAQERFVRNFGCANPEGYRKAWRQMELAEKFARPVVCFVDTSGAYPGAGAEERGVGQAIAENLYRMTTLKTPVISVMIGEGGSGGALALAVSDRVWMLENAYYSVISPEGCASILYKDASKADVVAEELKLSAEPLKELGIIEEILKEPANFTEESNKQAFLEEFKDKLVKEIKSLSKKSTAKLLAERYEKYRKIGRDIR